MKKLIYLIAIFCFAFSYAQLSKIEEIKQSSYTQHQELLKKYKNEFPEERKIEEAKIIAKQTAEIQEAIAFIQKNEPEMDFDSLSIVTTKPAEFETGINGFRNLIFMNFDTSTIMPSSDSENRMTAQLRFIIDENGVPTNARVEGDSIQFNQEIIITFYKIKEKNLKWKPAKLDGVAVKSVYRIPIVMQFEY